jgi:hypothetical protein
MTIARHSQRPVTRRLVREVLRRDPEDRWPAAFGRIARNLQGGYTEIREPAHPILEGGPRS